MLAKGGGTFATRYVPVACHSAEHPMAQRKHDPGPPMDLVNMREQG
jgi:hypothetical protein